jgi:G3E family GTPase
MTAALPVTVVGGYLGAGKTTLVNRLLREAAGTRRLAVLVNDFGSLPIDRDLIVAAGGDTIDIAGGCVCCSYGSDLVEALQALRRRDGIDHVVLETSGVALPGLVASTLTLLQGYALAGITVVADATQVRAQAADRYLADTIERQLAAADLVLLNKAELAGDALADTAGWLADRVPSAQVVTTRQCAVPIDLVLATRARPVDPAGGLRTPGATDAAGLYDSFVVSPPGPVDVAALGRRLAAMPGLLRAKGFLQDRDGQRRLLQVSSGTADLSPAPPTTTVDGLVVIVRRGALAAASLAALADAPL